MKKWLVYLLGIITGVILTFAFAFYVNLSNNSGIVGLEMFEEPGDYMEYSQFEVFQVVESGCALAHADDSFGAIVFIIPNKNQQFYDEQKIVLKKDQCAQRVGTVSYTHLPKAENFSLYSTCNGMKSVPGTASLAAQTVANSMVLPLSLIHILRLPKSVLSGAKSVICPVLTAPLSSHVVKPSLCLPLL